MKRILSLIGAGGLALLVVNSTQADIVFCTRGGYGLPGEQWGPGTRTFGTPFTVGSSAVTVTALGYFDLSNVDLFDYVPVGDGMVYTHQVGIYDLNQNLLGSVTVPIGTAGTTYHDGTRWVNLATPIALAANTGYVLAFTTSDMTQFDRVLGDYPWNLTIDPHFTLGDKFTTAWPTSDSLTYPGYPGWYSDYHFFGGNLEAVPEPSQYAAMGVILLSVAGYGFRRFRLNRAA